MPTYEQELVDRFVCAIRCTDDEAIKIKCLHNDNCQSRTYADVECTSVSDERWALEAKYGAPDNIQNEVYKLFGNLLHEASRTRTPACKIGLLLHHETESYFRDRMQEFDRGKFIQFGELIPVAAVFVFTGEGARYVQKTWAAFYDGTNT